MRRRRFGHRVNGRSTAAASELRLLAPAERHLTDRQLVDFVVGACSPAGALAARHHLAACSLCRRDLDNLRDVDRQLGREGGGRRLAAIPRFRPAAAQIDLPQLSPPPTAAPGRDEAAGIAVAGPRWHQVAVPLIAAVLALFVIKATVTPSLAPGLAPDRTTDVARAGTSSPTSSRGPVDGTWHVFGREAPSSREELSAGRPSGRIEAPPAAIAAEPSAVAAAECAADSSGPLLGNRPPAAVSADGLTAAAPTARTPPARRQVDATSRVAGQRHPGAGRNDDRISPPPRGLSV